MENQKNQSSLVNPVDSCKTLVGSCPKSPDHAHKTAEMIEKNGNFSVKVGFCPNSPDHAEKTAEMVGENGDFPVKEDSSNVEDEHKEMGPGLVWSPIRAPSSSSNWTDSLTTATESDPLDLAWFVAASDDNGPGPGPSAAHSNWAEWPLVEVKPITSFEPKNFQTNDETKPITSSIVPFVNHSFKLGVGLVNLGNTCFLNAVLQSFMHTVLLLQLLASNDHVSLCDSYVSGFCVICVIRELLDLSLASGMVYVTPGKLVSNLNHFSSSFNWYQQEDAHEFLQCFLDKLESCCNGSMPKDRAPMESDNMVKQVFGGRLISKLRCRNCGHHSNTYEPLIDLSLEIKDVDSLGAALESFTRVEQIDDPEIQFFCEKCKELVSMEKQLMLDEAPSVAAFHLKRFKNHGSFIEKIDKHVSFPLELDLLPYNDPIQNSNEEMKYDLYAVIVHSGSTSSSGHYYSFIRCAPNEWYKFDDAEVFQVHEELVLAEEAYIMFYAKRGTPWFSDFIQTQKPFIDPHKIYTSPNSVLDDVDAIPITSPCIPNNHASDVNESNDPADKASPKPELNKIEDNESKEILQTSSTPGPIGAINYSDFHELNKIVDNESKEIVQTSTPGPAGAINSSDSLVDRVDEACLPRMHKENNATQDIDVTEKTETSPSRSPSPEICRYDSPDEQHSEMKQTCSLIKKRIPGSRDDEQLMDALRVSDGESSLNEKKRKVEVSPSRDDRSSADRGSSSSFGSAGVHPVMASNIR